MDFIKRFEDRAPEYPLKYVALIDRFALKGGRDEDLKQRTGKAFFNYYEMFMYAAMLGLKNNCRLSMVGEDSKKFIEIRAWQPPELRQFILLSLLARAEHLDLNALEDLEEEEVEKQLTQLKTMLEEYAHGGFDLIDSKMRAEPLFFEGEFWVLEMLGAD